MGLLQNGARSEWGTRLEDYAPMCPRHASMLDGGGDLTTFPCGHPRKGNTTAAGACRPCKSAYDTARHRRLMETDADYRERAQEAARKRGREWARAKYQNDPEYREKERARKREYERGKRSGKKEQ